MRHLFIPILLIFLPTVANAGFEENPKPVLSAASLPGRREEPAMQCLGASGVDDANTVAHYTHLLRRKFDEIPTGVIVTCEFDGESIAVERYAERGVKVVLVTTVDDAKRLVYDPVQAQNAQVMSDMKTWTATGECPPSMVQSLMKEQLRRIFSCYPEEGFRVTTKAEDEATRKAFEEERQRVITGPKKNPGL